MELKAPITEVTCRIAAHTASVIINMPKLCCLTPLSHLGATLTPITFSGSESVEKKWTVAFSQSDQPDSKGYCARFQYADAVCVLDGKAELKVGTSPASLYLCKMGGYNAGCPVLTIPLTSPGSRISFTVKYFRPEVDEERHSLEYTNPDEEKLHVAYENLLSPAKYPDMTFVIGDEIIPAHKVILTGRVPYFDKMMSSGMEEAVTGRVKLDKGTNIGAFKEVLKYVYGGQLPASLSENAVHILPLADQYDLTRLKDACFYHMGNALTEENVFDTLIAADLYRGADLKQKCLQRLRQWCSTIESKFLHRFSEHPHLMIDFIQSK